MTALGDWFDGPSLLNGPSMFMGESLRHALAGDMVDSYRNLNRPQCFSVRARNGNFKGLVTGYGRAVVIGSPKLVVGEKSRQRCIEKGVRSVHSFVRGELLGLFDGDLLPSKIKTCIRVSYSPFLGGAFFQLERDAQSRQIPSSIRRLDDTVLSRCSMAILNGADVFLFCV